MNTLYIASQLGHEREGTRAARCFNCGELSKDLERDAYFNEVCCKECRDALQGFEAAFGEEAEITVKQIKPKDVAIPLVMVLLLGIAFGFYLCSAIAKAIVLEAMK